jgi:hypothetical protein
MVLNTSAAVKTFISHGSITLGGNVSGNLFKCSPFFPFISFINLYIHTTPVAIGPLGRNAEASGTASVKSIAAVYSYSKTKGLFAGLSFEGSLILERFDANTKLYGRRVKTRELLNGTIPPPPAAETLYRVLELKAQNRSTAGASTYRHSTFNSSTYHTDPNSNSDTLRRNSSQLTSTPISFSRGSIRTMAKTGLIEGHGGSNEDGYSRTTRRDDTSHSPIQISNTPYSSSESHNNELIRYGHNDITNRARALFNFRGEQEGDLPFQKGDVIIIIKKSDSQNDWWTGSLNGKEGIVSI